MRIVMDASAIVPFVSNVGTPSVEPYFAAENELHIPALCDAEVVGGLARQVRVGGLSETDASEALIDYVSMPLARHMHLRLVARTYELSHNFSATDASYVALAEALDADLVTLDRSLARATRELTQVRVLP
jgi:predicted nucleic acid-binding protein